MNKPDSKELGKWGEKIAAKFLRDKGYKKVTNLNKLCPNTPYADIYAEKGEEKLIISVKTRNKFGANEKKNPSYNLSYGNNDKRVKLAKRKFKWIPYWIAIEVDESEKQYSIYFGSLADLEGSNTISMKKCRERKICRECWVKEGISLPDDWGKEVKRIFKKDE